MVIAMLSAPFDCAATAAGSCARTVNSRFVPNCWISAPRIPAWSSVDRIWPTLGGCVNSNCINVPPVNSILRLRGLIARDPSPRTMKATVIAAITFHQRMKS